MDDAGIPRRLYFVRFIAPSFLGAIDDVEGAQLLLRAAQRIGFEGRSVEIRSRDDVVSLRREVAARSRADGLTLLCLSAHGRQRARRGHSEKTNLLMLHETDEADQFQSSLDLDAEVSAIRSETRGDLLLVVDACEVSLRPTLDGGTGVVALLAHPNGSAESVRGGGLLTRALASRIAGLEPGQTWSDVATATIDDVLRETSGRQAVSLVRLGATPFLQHSPVHKAASGAAETGLLDVLSSMIELESLRREDLIAVEQKVLLAPPSEEQARWRLRVASRLLQWEPTRERAESVEALLARLGESAPIDLRVRALHMLAFAQNRLGERENAQASAVRANKLCDLWPGSEPRRGPLLDTLGTIQRDDGHLHKASGSYRASMDVKRRTGDQSGIEMSRQNLGWVLLGSGEFASARECFEEGRRTCQEMLRDGRRQGVDVLARLVDSAVFHLVGATTVRLLMIEPPESFESLEEESSETLRIAETLARWGASAPVDLARLLLSIGRVDRRDGHQGASESADPVMRFWSLVRRTALEGAQHLPEVEANVRAHFGSQPLFGRMMFLAGTSFLCRMEHIAEAFDLRDLVINELRAAGYIGVPSVGAQQWRRTDERADPLTVDTSRWISWGPLGHQLAQSRARQVHVSYQLTEQYMQLLAWVSALWLCLEADLPLATALEEFGKVNPQGEKVQRTLGMSVLACQQVATKVRRDDLPGWVLNLRDVWRSHAVAKEAGYKDLKALNEERNKLAHDEIVETQAMREILARHERVIAAMLAPVPSADLPSVEPGPTVMASEPLRTVLLRSPRGKVLECGPLLMMHRDHADLLFVPKQIERKVLSDIPGSIQVKAFGPNKEGVCNPWWVTWSPNRG